MSESDKPKPEEPKPPSDSEEDKVKLKSPSLWEKILNQRVRALSLTLYASIIILTGIVVLLFCDRKYANDTNVNTLIVTFSFIITSILGAFIGSSFAETQKNQKEDP